MIDPMEIVESMCHRYQTAVSANDSVQYGKLFTDDAIRVPPGSQPEHGPDAIAKSEQRDYDVATWTVQSKSIDALWISDEWVYGIAEARINTVTHADGSTRSFTAVKAWLLQRQACGEWLIKRQLWHLRN